MEHGIVLDVGLAADDDAIEVGSDHRPEQDESPWADVDLAVDTGTGEDDRRWVDDGLGRGRVVHE
jgi:hypothetical protein